LYCSANTSLQEESLSRHHVSEFNDFKPNEPINIFRSILAQCSVLPDGLIFEPIRKAFQNSRRQALGERNLDLETIVGHLRTILKAKTRKITLIFDAIDECEDHGSFFSTLYEIVKSNPDLRVFLSSRYGLQLLSPDHPDFIPDHKRIEIQTRNIKDITQYVEREVSTRLRPPE
jgi:hypothetical protein